MRLSLIKKLSDHTAEELQALSKQTASDYSGMSMAIQDARNNSLGNRIFTIYHYRNSLNSQIGWLATMESSTRHEIWSFVNPTYRQRGHASQMFDLLIRELTPAQQTHTYFVHGYHHQNANRFYVKMKETHKNLVKLELLSSYYS